MTEPQEPRSAAPEHLTDEELSECAYSPETAAAGWLEHAEGCGHCAAEIADLQLVLAQLADLPEPAFPDEVGIRIDAALERAWQEADAEREAANAQTSRRRTRFSWRRLAVPLGALVLVLAAGAGLGALLHQGASSSSNAASVPNAAGAEAPDAALSQWVHSVLVPSYSAETNHAPAHALGSPMEECTAVPQRAGYTVETTSMRQFQGREATLVVYQNSEEPASTTVYAVVYAGSCPTSSSEILDQGPVSR